MANRHKRPTDTKYKREMRKTGGKRRGDIMVDTKNEEEKRTRKRSE